MKRQYLGDSKDSFKWDYHHFLLHALGYQQLTIAWVMNADDGSSEGQTSPELFPARREILTLCEQLRATRNPDLLLNLPATTGATYAVNFHTAADALNSRLSTSFFAGISPVARQVIFLDPDKGFEPERSSSNSHVRYADLDALLKILPPDGVITIFQHHRRKKFPDDFARIRERILSGYSTAIYWHSLMFVIISNSADTIEKVRAINHEYAQGHPVQILL
ncbi:MAG: hypothetical protein ACXW1C_00775 [Gallionella sp.]